jgi:hypothetical protein
MSLKKCHEIIHVMLDFCVRGGQIRGRYVAVRF